MCRDQGGVVGRKPFTRYLNRSHHETRRVVVVYCQRYPDLRGGAMNELLAALGRWRLDAKAVRERMHGAPTPRERGCWHAVWLLARSWSTPRKWPKPWNGKVVWQSVRNGLGACSVVVAASDRTRLQLPALAGIRAQTAQETPAQGQSGEAGGLCRSVHQVAGSSPVSRRQALLRRRGPFSG
jgi:hypothetical protein